MNPSVVSVDHADVHLERAVVRWLAELVGFPHAPGAGLLTSGGSGGRETLRACILHPDTSSEHLATLVAEVVATARTLVAAE
jgi:glutamate/tyrosine decarboxylase-like PLP-dependent enzyme